MVWVESLELKKWIIQVFAGSATYFAPIAIFMILSMAGFFRMPNLIMGFMIFIFLAMFSGFIPPSLLIFISIIGGLLASLVISRIVK